MEGRPNFPRSKAVTSFDLALSVNRTAADVVTVDGCPIYRFLIRDDDDDDVAGRGICVLLVMLVIVLWFVPVVADVV